MTKFTHFYLIKIQYLGYRFSGWAKQKDVKTVHFMIDKTLDFVLGQDTYKSLGGSRTDRMVSAEQSAFQLFLYSALSDDFLLEFNKNLPPDIKALSVETVDEKFNIIQTSKLKTYHYLFSFGEKPHPFSSSLVAYIQDHLDIEKMQRAAKLFEGTHNFKRFCTQPKVNTKFVRTIVQSNIQENKLYTASFFPTQSWIYTIQSAGFMRNQIRLMMAQLLALGKGNITEEEFADLLNPTAEGHLSEIAPPSGLILHQNHYE